jgi:signal peptidase I
MVKAFRDRRPWAASLICLVFGPVLGMLYLNRGRYACFYCLGSILLVVLFIVLWPTVFPSKILHSIYLIDLPIKVAGSIQGFFLAKQWSPEIRLKWYAHWYSVVGITLVFPVLLAFGIRTFFLRPFDIPSTSMVPTVNRGDHFFVSRRAYDFSSPQRGDVVVFYVPAYRAYFVKRIVGLPGDRVQMVHGRLSVNGIEVPTRRLVNVTVECATGKTCQAAQYEETYPGGKKGLVLDQVSDGPLDNTGVFPVPENSYFVLGDNRDNSSDSRTELGLVPRSAIIGKPAYKFFAAGRWMWQSIN